MVEKAEMGQKAELGHTFEKVNQTNFGPHGRGLEFWARIGLLYQESRPTRVYVRDDGSRYTSATYYAGGTEVAQGEPERRHVVRLWRWSWPVIDDPVFAWS